MARIKIQDYIKDVELNRQRLVNATGSDLNASLTSIVNELISDTSIKPQCNSYHEVRFFDGDGSLLSKQFIEHGKNVIPPANPNLDSEKLVFDKWYSIIGNNFENIQHDVDYGAHYSVIDEKTTIFFEFSELTGYTIYFRIRRANYQGTTIYIDWGDGSDITILNDDSSSAYLKSFSHTYSPGKFMLSIYSDTLMKDSSFYWYVQSNYVNSFFGTSSIGVNDPINAAYIGSYSYIPLLNSDSGYNLGNTFKPKFMLCEKRHGSWGLDMSLLNAEVAIVPVNPILSTSAYSNSDSWYCRVAIFDKDLSNYKLKSGSAECYIYRLQKLLLPALQNTDSNSPLFSRMGTSTTNSSRNTTLKYICSYAKLGAVQSCPEVHLCGDLISSANSISDETYVYEYPIDHAIAFPSSIGTSYQLSNFIIPKGSTYYSNTFTYCYALENIIFQENINIDLNLQSARYLSLDSILNILNNACDNNDNSVSRVLTINLNAARYFNRFVENKNGIFIAVDTVSNESISILEAFHLKNWTVSTYTSQ